MNDCWVAQVHNQFASNHNQVMDFCPHKYSIHACQVQLISLVLYFDKTFQNDYNLKSKRSPNGLLSSSFFKYWVLGEAGDWSLHAWVLSSIKQDKFQGAKRSHKKTHHMGCWALPTLDKKTNNCVSQPTTTPTPASLQILRTQFLKYYKHDSIFI